MQCDLTGAVMRESPSDPKSKKEHLSGRCKCDCVSPFEMVRMEVKGVECDTFRGCPRILSGEFEKYPKEWKSLEGNPEIDLWMDSDQTTPTRVKVEDLKCKPGKVREMKRAGVSHHDKKPKKEEGGHREG